MPKQMCGTRFALQLVRGLLVEGGHGKVNAKVISEFIRTAEGWGNLDMGDDNDAEQHAAGIDDSDATKLPEMVDAFLPTFSFKKPSVNKSDSEVGKSVAAYISGIGGWPVHTCNSLEKYLKKKGQRKNGCMGPNPLLQANVEWPFEGWSEEAQQNEAGTSWIIALRPNRCRMGHSAFPYVGFGNFVMSPNTAFYMQLIDIASVLAQGLQLDAVESFLGTKGGEEFFSEEMATAAL